MAAPALWLPAGRSGYWYGLKWNDWIGFVCPNRKRKTRYGEGLCMTEPRRFLMMAGGTGGHVFPALATARALQERGHEVYWLGASGGMEERLVGNTDIRSEEHTS